MAGPTTERKRAKKEQDNPAEPTVEYTPEMVQGYTERTLEDRKPFTSNVSVHFSKKGATVIEGNALAGRVMPVTKGQVKRAIKRIREYEAA